MHISWRDLQGRRVLSTGRHDLDISESSMISTLVKALCESATNLRNGRPGRNRSGFD